MGAAAGDRRPELAEWLTRAGPGSPPVPPDMAGAGPLAGTHLPELVVPSADHVTMVAGVSLSHVLDTALETALALLRADLGTIQINDPAAGALRIAVQAGFNAEFLQYFAVVSDDRSACGRAARGLAQVVIADVREDPPFAPHREIAAASGFRAVQSTPLVDQDGRLLGMLSTHYPRPYRPPAADLAVMRQLGALLGQVMSTSWRAAGPEGPVARLPGPASRERVNGPEGACPRGSGLSREESADVSRAVLEAIAGQLRDELSGDQNRHLLGQLPAEHAGPARDAG